MILSLLQPQTLPKVPLKLELYVDSARQDRQIRNGRRASGDDEGRKVFFIIQHKDNVVTVIDIAKQEVIKSIPVGTGKKQAHGSCFTPDGKYYYMINAEDNNLVKIDVAKMEAVSKIPVGKSAMFFSIKEGSDFPSTE